MSMSYRCAALAVLLTGAAAASTFTMASPTGSNLPGGVTPVGGIVLDLIGSNGTRVVSQLAASSLYIGFSDDGTPVSYRGNPLTIGIQTGFTPALLAGLGGGLAEAAVRISLFDGDTGAGNFDDNENTLLLNDIAFGNFSDVVTEQTNSSGASLGALNAAGGFRNNILDTGFFYSTNAATLAALFGTLGAGEIRYTLSDVDPTDNYFDFTQGIDGGLIDVGSPPVIAPSVPEPSTYALLISGLAAFAFLKRRQ